MGRLGHGSPRLLDMQLPPAVCTPGRSAHSLRPVAWRSRPTRRANGRTRTCMAFQTSKSRNPGRGRPIRTRTSVEVVRQVSRAGKAIRAQHPAPDRRLKELFASSARPTRPVDLRVGFVPGVRDLAGHDVRARLDPSRIANHPAHVSVHSLPACLRRREKPTHPLLPPARVSAKDAPADFGNTAAWSRADSQPVAAGPVRARTVAGCRMAESPETCGFPTFRWSVRNLRVQAWRRT